MTFTIVTTTFNRLPLLQECYASLLEQSNLGFEWLVVDDGSTDGTTAALKAWASAAPFPIRALSQRNGGKHRALNRAFSYDLRRFAVLLDSDDRLSPTCIEQLLSMIEFSEPENVIGFIGNRHYRSTGKTIGPAVPSSVVTISVADLRERFGVTGDTFRVYKSSYLQRFRFPEFPGENFLPENVVLDPLDALGDHVVLRGTYYLCEYQDDGYSANIWRHRAMSPRGYAASLESSACYAVRFSTAVRETLKFQLWCKCFFGDYGSMPFRRRTLFRCCLPIARILNRLGRPHFRALAGELSAEYHVTTTSAMDGSESSA